MEHHESVREVYRECVRNHSLRHGGSYTIDGCCKFIPTSGDEQLQCGACGCHRNFHRADYCIVATLPVASGRRRPRTRFTEEQKQSMARYAERIGWMVPRGRAMGADEAVDQFWRFCREIGVSKQAFKVWMHNHKGSSSAAPAAAQVASSEATTSSGAAMDGGEEEEVIKIGDEEMEEEETKDLD
ncbi:zinc-finger homeodomain protein 11-like [Curcuma longa]|uniref:zinc-finger homeodomain protein 11-like n=1 Tax=Curcuma longa TaxID=136217 RepID=UPI003D9F6C82